MFHVIEENVKNLSRTRGGGDGGSTSVEKVKKMETEEEMRIVD